MRKSDAFNGKLDPQSAAEGMNAAMDNARRLVADAQLLLDAGRSASAAALAILAIEESGKTSILRGLVLTRDAAELKDSWKSYRSHKAKNVAWILPQLVADGARSLEDFRPLFAAEADHPQALDDLKQLAFYTDCLGAAARWSRPDSTIARSSAEMLVKTAEILAAAPPTTPREIDLWIEHIGPVWRGPLEWMKTALEKWDAAMRAEGLKPESAAPRMDQFVRGHADE